MHALSIFLIVVAALAVVGLVYEEAAGLRRRRHQENFLGSWQRPNGTPLPRLRGGK